MPSHHWKSWSPRCGCPNFAFPMLVLLSDLFPWLAHWHALFLALFSAKIRAQHLNELDLCRPRPWWSAVCSSCSSWFHGVTMVLPWHMWHSAALGSSGCWRLVQDPSKRRCMMWIIILCIWHFMVRMCIYVYTYIRTYTYYTYNDMRVYMCIYIYCYFCIYILHLWMHMVDVYIYTLHIALVNVQVCVTYRLSKLCICSTVLNYMTFLHVYIYMCVCCKHICGFSFFLTTRTTCMYTTSILYMSLYHTCAGIIWA